MARMKFLCDADRCIECNACVTACKNEHEVPWGINRRRVVTINDGKPGERSVSMACMHCTDAPCQAVCPVNCFYTTADGVVLHSKDLCIGCGYCFYACPFGAPQYPARRQLRLARQDGQVHLLRRRSGSGRHARPNMRSTAPTVWPKASCRYAPRCARPNRCSPATARSSRRSTRNAWSSAVTAPAPGAGRPLIARPSHLDPERGASRSTRCSNRDHRRKWHDDCLSPNSASSSGRWRSSCWRSARSLRAAQQPTSVNPQASAVKEDQLFQELNRISGRCTLPDQKACTIEQPAGRDWRHFHEVTLRWIGGIVIIGILAVLVIFYLWRGMVRIESGRSGRTIVRFNALRAVRALDDGNLFHHSRALGAQHNLRQASAVAAHRAPKPLPPGREWAKYAHNYLSFPFTIGVILIFLMWIAGNIPNRVDVEWLKRGGGIVGHDHPPAYRFNAGQKMIYWIVVLGGTAVAVSGYVLMFPFYGTDIASMQAAQIVHGIVAMLFVAAMIGHIYIGTIGMEGAFEAMGTGTVDLNWAKEHHNLWLEEEKARADAGAAQRKPIATAAE